MDSNVIEHAAKKWRSNGEFIGSSFLLISLLIYLLIPRIAVAANGDDGLGRIDYDLNDNGLIEINDLADLNEIRNNLDGSSLYSASTGCPAAGCNGFELSTDLDFDSNQDGIMDARDDYWNAGEGWLPIAGDRSLHFTGILEGNGYVISNLYINRPNSEYIGLFGRINNAQIRQLGLSGPLMSVIGNQYTGSIVGVVIENSIINAVFNTGSINGYRNVGGLVGYVGKSNQIRNSFNTGSVTGTSIQVGGLVGVIISNNQISASFNSGYVTGRYSSGGLIGFSSNSVNDINNSYWAVDSTNQNLSYKSSESSGYVGLTLATLKCAVVANTNADNSNCVSADGSGEDLSAGLTLYAGWEESGYWTFGNNQQLPGLILNSKVYHDSDSDGVLDEYDAFFLDSAASIDSDNDGYPDSWNERCDDTCIEESGLIIDQFPDSVAAWQDRDLDNLVDFWATNCDVACQIESGLTLDTSLNDSDNDGINNSDDNDDNNDGVIDIDADSDGLIEVSTLAQLDAIRHQLDGAGYRANSDSELNIIGCPIILYQGHYQAHCSGYELSNDLDFDSNQDGALDGQDEYWNDGEGWLPLETFTGIFEGNSNVIKNLFINRLDHSSVGLFGGINGAQVRQVGLVGSLASVTGSSYAGGLVGGAFGNNRITACYNTGPVTGGEAGGLVGSVNKNNHITASYSTGSVTGNVAGGLVGHLNESNQIIAAYSTGPVFSTINTAGGLIGSVAGNNQISASFSSGNVSGDGPKVGGLIGFAGASDNTINNSYWAIDSSGQASSYSSKETTSYVGLTLATLQCATEANTDAVNSNCVSVDGSDEELSAALTLYADWQVSGYWEFGNDQQLPGLKLASVIYRDSDGDGSLDEYDAFHLNPIASIDDDNDGYPDAWTIGCDDSCIEASGFDIDQFPNSAAAGKDTDLDGLADEWAAGCDEVCQNNSDLTLDLLLNDSDNDGLPNSVDTDDNNDGISDRDSDSDGLINISTLAQLDAVRYQLDGKGYRAASDAELDESGCPIIFFKGNYQRRCIGYELSNNLDFDSNQDGQMNANDDFWGDGKGWSPIGDYYTAPFRAVFDGNGYVIKNLYINRPYTSEVGLFGSIKDSTIQQLGLSGPLMSVTGGNAVGAVAGSLYNNNDIRAVFNTGSIEGGSHLGGLIGYVDENNQISASYNTGSVTGRASFVGGLVGYVSNKNEISNSYNSGYVNTSLEAGGLIGGLIGGMSSSVIVNNSYWATDNSNQNNSASSSEITGYLGLTLAVLQCAINANTDISNSNCVSADGGAEGLSVAVTLFKGWDASGYWDFGNHQQLPSLNINGIAYRDSDGDGFLDENDAFYLNAEASIDDDNDGYPDMWAEHCDTQCQQNSTLEIDPSLSDSDNDYIKNSEDAYPLISIGNLTDTDRDGAPNNCDDDCIDMGMTADNDDDNDGVLDINDPDLGIDNGDPILTSIAADASFSVNTENSSGFLLAMDSKFMENFVATDALSPELIFRATLDGELLVPDEDNKVFLPAGNLDIHWVAIDDAGRVSNTLIQNVKVYPQVRFKFSEGITGKPSNALIEVELSGDSPDYPVIIELEIDALSDIDQGDLSDSFNISSPHYVEIEKSNNESEPYNSGILVVPLNDMGASGSDELLLLNIKSVMAVESESFLFSIESDSRQYRLTVTERNLYPLVRLQLEQGGGVVDSVQSNGGEVKVTALISDANGNDTHTVDWNLNSLNITAPLGNILTFSPVDLDSGNYSLSILVTDDGIDPKSSSAELSFDLIKPVLVDNKQKTTSGGDLQWIFLLLMGIIAQLKRYLPQVNLH